MPAAGRKGRGKAKEQDMEVDAAAAKEEQAAAKEEVGRAQPEAAAEADAQPVSRSVADIQNYLAEG